MTVSAPNSQGIFPLTLQNSGDVAPGVARSHPANPFLVYSTPKWILRILALTRIGRAPAES